MRNDMTSNKLTRERRRRSAGDASNPNKSPQVLPTLRLYYNFEDAVNFAHFKNPDLPLTSDAIVHYAVVELFDLLTHAPRPDSLLFIDKRKELTDVLSSSHDQPCNIPDLLVLSKEDCFQIEAKKITHQSDFKTGLTVLHSMLQLTHPVGSGWEWRIISDYPSTPSQKDVTALVSTKMQYARNHSDKTSMPVPVAPHIQKEGINQYGAICKYYPKPIPLTKENILISHDNLAWLIQVLEDKIKRNEANNKPHNVLPEITVENAGNARNRAYYSLVDESAKNPAFTSLDLIRRAIKRKIPLLIIVPYHIKVCSYSEHEYHNFDGFQRQPQFLELDPLDCEHIYHNQIDNEKTNVSEFTAGYILENLDHMVKLLPSKGTKCRTFQGGFLKQLELSSEWLVVMESDLARLTAPEPQDFDIPQNIKEFLLPKHYLSLENAVKHAKLKYPECTSNHLLKFGKLKTLEFISPVPVGIKLHKDRCQMEVDDKSQSDKDAPELLALSWFDCEKIERNGSVFENCFSKGYSISTGQLKTRYATDNRDRWWWLTYYKRKLHEIELTPDRLFVTSENLFQIINSEPDLWVSIDNELKASAEQKFAQTKADNQQNSTETITDESSNVGVKVNQESCDGIVAAIEQQEQNIQNEGQSELTEDYDWILEDEVLAIVDFQRRKMQKRIAANQFPKGTIRGNKNNWKRSEFLAWYEANKSEPVITGKRKPKANIAVEKDTMPTEGLPPQVSK